MKTKASLLNLSGWAVHFNLNSINNINIQGGKNNPKIQTQI